MDTVFLIGLFILLPVVSSYDVKVSKACYGPPGNLCTTHSLRCSGEKIAILDAFYSTSSKCNASITECDGFDVDKEYTNRSSELSAKDTNKIYRLCSLKGRCEVNAPWQPPSYYSVVKYMCIRESKACSGTKGKNCTTHSLDCSDDQIAILDAVYLNNTNCSITRTSDCSTVNFQNYTEPLRQLNEIDTDDLYRSCSLEGRCDWLASENGTINFSVVDYICINATTDICSMETVMGDNITLLWNNTNTPHTCSCTISTNHPRGTVVLLDMLPKYRCSQLNITIDGNTMSRNCSTNNPWPVTSTNAIVLHPVNALLGIQILGAVNGSCITSTEGQASLTIIPTQRANDDAQEGQENGQSSTTTSALPLPSASEDGNGGAIAGGVTAVIIVFIIVAGVIFWLKFMRNKKSNLKSEKGNDNCALAGSASINDVQHVNSRKKTSNYDYTTINDGVNPVGRAQNHYVPAGKPSTVNGTTVLMEDDYNHINHNPSQGASSPGYDTTASAVAAVKKLNNVSSNSIEDDDYNHLGDGKPSVVSSDYDTTVSASKAVAKLGAMNGSGDDYDHFKRSEDRVVDSPYDIANHHSSVSADTTISPYDLAK